MATDEWVQWEHNKPPKPGTRLRLKFRNEAISAPITFVDGRGLNWGKHEYSWRRTRFDQNGWLISHYQILKD